MSTDPAKAAAVEKHAAELKARPAAAVQAKPATTHHKSTAHAKQAKASTKTAAKPATTK